MTSLQATWSATAPRRGAPPAPILWATVLLGALSVAVWASGVMSIASRTDAPSRAERAPLSRALPEPQSIRNLTAEQAIALNAARPIAAAPDRSAAPFVIAGTPASRASAVRCLAQAIYYEAASEDEAGQRAVAQVVLNRVRHPAFPASVCGVVFQGWERPTGCQFSFTCDGSLVRAPSNVLWARAIRLAKAALTGSVEPSVGHATHYHADYVVPYWADSLAKTATLGRHIFYRWPGSVGTAAAFEQRYSAREPDAATWGRRDVPPPPLLGEAVVAETPTIVTDPDASTSTPAAELTPPEILADRTAGTLAAPAGVLIASAPTIAAPEARPCGIDPGAPGLPC
jgi:spore germination cell wall hydrolase CwlJ-like protein